jgi:hypothetical protein
MSSAVRPVARVVHLVLADVFSYAACDQLAGRGRREGNTNRDAARWRQETVDIQLSYIDWTGSRDAAWKTRTEAPTEA